ncbi:MAG: hypothetical protein ACLP6G_22300 [Terriglobales bacterium]
MNSRIAVSLLFVLIAASAATQSDAQRAFAKLKTLVGAVESYVTSFPPQADRHGKLIQISLRVTSMGNTLMHEMQKDLRNCTEKEKGE